MSRPFNFSAGPATLPETVLTEAAASILDWQGSGVSVMEMSHRSDAFVSILSDAENAFRRLMAVPENFHVLFMQGGATGFNAMVPLNLMGPRGHGTVDVVVSGHWSQRSMEEADRYVNSRAAIYAGPMADGLGQGVAPVSQWKVSPAPVYVHLCSNETIDGLEFREWPDLAGIGKNAPLVVDFSSNILSKPFDWGPIGLAFGGAQKNMGIAGLTMVVVRDDLLDQAMMACPLAFHLREVVEGGGMLNTPPTWAIYMSGLVMKWVEAQEESGVFGVEAMALRSDQKSQAIYGAIDSSEGFYSNPVHPDWRSRINIPFVLRDPSLDTAFLQEAKALGLISLKGHKSVGGMRASLYNALPVAAAQALAQHMRDFAQRHG